MRDAHRMKEKFDLSLDNRQIVGLLIGSIVVVGTVFVLGVVVGKKLAEGNHPSAAPDLLSALDEKAAAIDKARAEPPLTFQEELTKKGTDHPPKAEPANPASVSTPAPAVPPEEEKIAAAAPPAVAPKVVPAKATAFQGQAKPPPARPAFSLQLSATQQREEADGFATRLRQKGYQPYVLQAQVPGKGTWYRVRLGSFPNKDAAERYLKDFRRETRLEAFIAAN